MYKITIKRKSHIVMARRFTLCLIYLLPFIFSFSACGPKSTMNSELKVDFGSANMLDRPTFFNIANEALIRGDEKAFKKIDRYFSQSDRIDELFFYWFIFTNRHPSAYTYDALSSDFSFDFIDDENDHVIKAWSCYFDLQGARIGSERCIMRLERLATECKCEPRNVAYILEKLAKQKEGNRIRVKVYRNLDYYYTLLERAKKLGDTVAYNEARRYAFQNNITNEFFHVSFIVACRYNYGEAYYDLYSKIKSIVRVDSTDATIDDFAQYWLVKALEEGTVRSTQKASEFYPSGYYLLKIMENLYR